MSWGVMKLRIMEAVADTGDHGNVPQLSQKLAFHTQSS